MVQLTTEYRFAFIHIGNNHSTVICTFLPAGHAQSMQPAGPRITLRFLRLYLSLCVCTYHVCN